MSDENIQQEAPETFDSNNPDSMRAAAAEVSARRAEREPTERLADHAYERGERDEAAKLASRDLASQRRPSTNQHVNDYLNGNMVDERIKVSDPDSIASTNQNTPGTDPRKAALALEQYRAARQAQIDIELAVHLEGRPNPFVADGAHASPSPQEAPTEAVPAPAVQEPPEVAAERERALNEIRQARELHAQAATHLLKSTYQDVLNEFADVRTDADVVKLAQSDPARFTKLQFAAQKISSGLQAVSQHEQRQAAEFRQFAAAEDARVLSAVPELRNPVRYAETRDLLLNKVLPSYGVDVQSFMNAFDSSPLLRSAEAQKMLYDLARYHESKARASQPAPKPVARVQRPGVARPSGESDAADGAFAEFSARPNARNAARLVAARRASR